MVKLFAELKIAAEAKSEAVFDLEEALEYFEKTHDLRFMEEEQKESMEEESRQQIFPKAKAALMRVYEKRTLLDELVDFYNANPEGEDFQ